MGQKVNPHGARVGVILDWSTKWYAGKKDFSNNLIEDYKLREMLKEKLNLSGVTYLGQEKKHVAGYLYNGADRLRLVGFSQGGEFARWQKAGRVEAVCTLQQNVFRGRYACELICLGLSPRKSLQSSREYTIIESAFLCALTDGDARTQSECVSKLIRFFPFRLSEETLRPIYVTLMGYVREGRLPDRDEERAAALIFKELGFFEPVTGLQPVIGARRRSCAESQLFMALSTR